MNTKEAAKRWGVTKKEAYRYCEEGMVPTATKTKNKLGLMLDYDIPLETLKPSCSRRQAVVMMENIESIKNENANPWIRGYSYDSIIDIYEYLRDCGFISDFEVSEEVGKDSKSKRKALIEALKKCSVTLRGKELIDKEKTNVKPSEKKKTIMTNGGEHIPNDTMELHDSSQSRKIKWIHISDLHLGKELETETVLMRRKLPDYIRSLNQSFDYAFCTGDIKEWSSDYTYDAEFIRNLCNASNTKMNNLYIVPGNHDIDISNEDRNALIEDITDWEKDIYDSKVGIISSENLELLRSGETMFRGFIKEVLGTDREKEYNNPHFALTTECFNIVHLNTTLTYGKNHDRDFIIGTRMLTDAFKNCDELLPTIILSHYPFDYLTLDEQREVEALMASYNVRLWFAGHEHNELITWKREKFLECLCGNVSLQKGARACFLVGEYDVETHEGIITVHAWYDSKGWAQYPFARTESDDNSIFPFDLKKYYTVPMVRKRKNTKCIEKKTTNGTGLKNRRSPKFVIKEDKNGKIRYDVKGINGEIVFSSQPYDSEKECKEAIAHFSKQTLSKLYDEEC